jgi:uncharacterized membrane protein YdcZ (DUF606 family)
MSSSSLNINLSQSNILIFIASFILLFSVIIHLAGIFTPRTNSEGQENKSKAWLNWIGGIFIVIAIVVLYIAYITKCARLSEK